MWCRPLGPAVAGNQFQLTPYTLFTRAAQGFTSGLTGWAFNHNGAFPSALDVPLQRSNDENFVCGIGSPIMRSSGFETLSALLSDAPMATLAPREFAGSPTRRTEAIARLQRQRLIAAATELFSRQGYRNTALREIAADAGCATSTIRREFSGKIGLLEEVIRACGVCDGVQAPSEMGGPRLQEDIGWLTAWEVDRMRGQRAALQGLLPQDSFDPIILQVAGRLSLGGSTQILHQRLRKHGVGDGEREFLVSAIQAVGFALGWSGFEEANRVMFKVKQVAKVLAGGLEQV